MSSSFSSSSMAPLLPLILLLLCASTASAYDYFMLAQQWGSSYCRAYGCSPSGDPNRWTIHGLWPTTPTTPYPAYCEDVTYSKTAIQSIEDELVYNWPSYASGNDHHSFWEHEWTKHGSCSLEHAQVNTQLKYFDRGLTLQSTYSVTAVLSKAGITPSDSKTYTLSQLTAAFSSQWGVIPEFDCGSSGGKTYLVEIRPCYDKANMKPMTCGKALAGVLPDGMDPDLVPARMKLDFLRSLRDRVNLERPHGAAGVLSSCPSSVYLAASY